MIHIELEQEESKWIKLGVKLKADNMRLEEENRQLKRLLMQTRWTLVAASFIDKDNRVFDLIEEINKQLAK